MNGNPCVIRALPLALLLALGGCGASDQHEAPEVPGANAARGRVLANEYGCGACHVIPGVQNARGMVGPPLTSWRQRGFIAGVLPNRPDLLVRWIMTPQAIVPGNAMPDLGVSQRDAGDIAEYLYTIQ